MIDFKWRRRQAPKKEKKAQTHSENMNVRAKIPDFKQNSSRTQTILKKSDSLPSRVPF